MCGIWVTMDQDTGTPRILLIDDEESVLDVTQHILKWVGYQVTAVSSSIEALELFREDPTLFDLVITDMVMPHMTGVHLARHIREIRFDMPVILYSGCCEPMTIEQARANGIKAFIPKPVRVEELVSAVGMVLLDAEAAPPSEVGHQEAGAGSQDTAA